MITNSPLVLPEVPLRLLLGSHVPTLLVLSGLGF